MSSKILVIRDPKKRLKVFDTHIMIDDSIIGFYQINSIYLINSHKLAISECYKLSKKIDFFIIDHNGYIKSTISKYKDD